MKKKTKQRLEEILEKTTVTSIRSFATDLSEIRKELDEKDSQVLSNIIRDQIQKEAANAVKAHTGYSMVVMATGTGKSKIAVDLSAFIVDKEPQAKIILSVPTIKLRDIGWEEEFTKWEQKSVWDNNVRKTCYASLHKIKNEQIAFVTLDEGHNFTVRNEEFLKDNAIERCVLFTATKPTDKEKLAILDKYGFKVVYELNLDEAVKLGLVAPYEITVINMQLDDVYKYVKSGGANKPFYQTEAKKYQYLTDLFEERGGAQIARLRMRLIYNLKSKTNVAKLILQNVIPKELRGLIFCGGIEQAIDVCPKRFFAKPALKKTDTPEQKKRVEEILKHYRGDQDYLEFRNETINRLACCQALNEGENFPTLDFAFVIQMNSKELDIIQRIGRIIRFRPGHTGRIIILCANNTVDKGWVAKALINLDPERIKYVELNHLRMGLETIKFD